jgi:hypothetical protein
MAAQPVLATMPLHAITALYGEQGLRERLALETAAFSGADQSRIAAALELAGRLHQADRRQREPYVNHLLRVALRIICHYEVLDADLTCAALLHDSVEDHAGQLSQSGTRAQAFAALAERLGPGRELRITAGRGREAPGLQQPTRRVQDRRHMHVGVSIHADRHHHLAVHKAPSLLERNGSPEWRQRRTAQGRGTRPQALIRSPRRAHRAQR